jgi:hypothetical protein
MQYISSDPASCWKILNYSLIFQYILKNQRISISIYTLSRIYNVPRRLHQYTELLRSLKAALRSPAPNHTRLESELSAKVLYVKARSPPILEAEISPFPASFINPTPPCCTTNTMIEEIKREVVADYWPLAKCRYWDWNINIHKQK